MLYFFETKKTKVSMRRTWLHKLRRERLRWRGVLSKRSGACVLRRGCCECCRFRLSRRCHARWRGTLRNARRRHHTAKEGNPKEKEEELLKSHTHKQRSADVANNHSQVSKGKKHQKEHKRNTSAQVVMTERVSDKQWR